MNKEIYDQNASKLHWMIGIIVGILCIYGAVIGITYITISHNDKKIEAILDKTTYTEDHVQTEMKELEAFTDDTNISDKTLGHLYKALAELSYMTGDDMLYNKYVATALFYLEKNQEKEGVVYLTNKYMGRLYANGCYEAAEDLLEGLSEKYQVSDFSLELQASYYLSRADLSQMLHKNDKTYLKAAKAAITLMDEGSEKKLNQGKLDLLTVRHDIGKSKWKQAKKIISGYTEKENFGYGQNQVYVICDFLIPYEELMAKIEMHDENVEESKKHIQKYLDLCEQYQFRTMELNLLIYVNDQPAMKKSSVADTYDQLEKNVLQRNLDEITNEYAQILLSDMNNTKHTLSVEIKSKKQKRRYMHIAFFSLILLCAGGFIIAIIMDYLQKDVLTKLNTRKKYEKLRLECEKKKIPYGFLIIDIDDFKKVNDTLGHHQGDIVISGVASILSKYEGRGIYAFRYGGEELCMMLVRVSKERTHEIAEEIRKTIEKTSFVPERKITVSGGISMSLQGENVFVDADEKLYQAKKNGKNQIQV